MFLIQISKFSSNHERHQIIMCGLFCNYCIDIFTISHNCDTISDCIQFSHSMTNINNSNILCF